jgi:hypothetical protein
MPTIDRTKSIEELEASVWPHDPYPSRLVQECQRIRKVSLASLSVEHLRMLIGQKIALQYLVPIALEHLHANPLCSGDFYTGDLLVNLLAVPDDYWASHPEENNSVVELAVQLRQIHDLLATEVLPTLSKFSYR